jgi:hypothetical protein
MREPDSVLSSESNELPCGPQGAAKALQEWRPSLLVDWVHLSEAEMRVKNASIVKLGCRLQPPINQRIHPRNAVETIASSRR